MNRDLLRDYFDKDDVGVWYDEKDRGFVLKTNTLSPEMLSVISIADGTVADHDMFGQFWVIDNQ